MIPQKEGLKKYQKMNSQMLRKRFGLELNPAVFFTSSGLILLFVIAALARHEQFEDFVTPLQQAISQNVGWFLISVMNILLVFSLVLLFSRFGKIRLGGPDAEPEFTTLGWLAMLFSAGMGIGLVFWSVAEPISHFASPPRGEPMTPGAAREAMKLTFFHWGLHPWALYAIVGLSLAFFSYNRGLPLTIRSVFYPLLGRKIYGPIGHLIDIVAVVATFFGIATSLGFGVQQISTGFEHVFGFEQTPLLQILLISGITLIATGSVFLGLDGGIRRISVVNLYLAGFLLLMVFLLGPTLFILKAFGQNIGAYLQDFIQLSTWTETYDDQGWQIGWTAFYWGWWIAWAPFVGTFIAQISRGRTIKEFILGTLLVPTGITFLWLTVFGDAAIFHELHGGGGLSEIVQSDVSMALFALLDTYPLGKLAAFVSVIVIILFFVTSSDSGSLVIDVISSGGHTDPPVIQRIFWALLEGVVAAILLVGGGLAALQTAAITTGFPFAIVLLLMCVGLYKGLARRTEEEVEEGERASRPAKNPPGPITTISVPDKGRGWVVLEWNAPEEGGEVAAYRIRRRKADGVDNWHMIAMTLEESSALYHMDGSGDWQYQVIAVNRAGEGPPSPEVTVTFESRHEKQRDGRTR